MPKKILIPDKKTVATFLATVEFDAKFHTMVAISERGDVKGKLRPESFFKFELERDWQRLVDLNVKGYGIFLTANATDGLGRKKQNIVGVRYIWADDDTGEFQLPAAFPQPNIRVETSPGKFQNWWRVSGISRPDHEMAMKFMVKNGSDPSAKDLSRLLRVAGFYHQKKEPFLVRIADRNGLHSIGKKQLSEWIDFKDSAGCLQGNETDASSAVCMPGIDPELAEKLGWEWLREHAPQAEEGSRDNTAVVVANKLYDFGVSRESCASMLHQWGQENCYPPLGNDDSGAVERIVRSALSSRQQAVGVLNPAVGFEKVNSIDATSGEKEEKFPRLFENSASRWKGKTPKPHKFLDTGYFPLGQVTLLVSAGGRGKSTLALQLTTCVAAGTPFLGKEITNPGSVAGIYCEDPDGTLQSRVMHNCVEQEICFDTISSKVDPQSVLGLDATLWKENSGATPLMDQIEQDLSKRPDCRALVLDGSSHMFCAPEIHRGEVTRFLARLAGIGQRYEISIILLHHESKSTQDDDVNAASGSTAWLNACRSVLKLGPVDEHGNQILKHIKSNLGPRQDPLTIRMERSTFKVVGDTARQASCLEWVGSMMNQLVRSGKNLSPNNKAPRNYAPKVLLRHQRGTDYSVAEIEKSVDELIGKTISIEEYPCGSKTAQRYRLLQFRDKDTSRTHTHRTHADTSTTKYSDQQKMRNSKDMQRLDTSNQKTHENEVLTH